jgi:predicted DNA-binding transcriptional regulator YafY
VEAGRGIAGGYRLVAGTAMPPLVLDDDETAAIAAGPRTAAGRPADGIEESSARAPAELGQVLPARLRRRVTTLGTATVAVPATGPLADPAQPTVFAGATTHRETGRFRYTAGDGTATRHRALGPVVTGRRRYLAFGLDRDDGRVFRAGHPPPAPRPAPRPPGRVGHPRTLAARAAAGAGART